ncbi:unnamed protein product, partial [Rotaria sp. Silwood1]
IHGDERQARIISALFSKTFYQDDIDIGSSGVEEQNHSVVTVNKDWSNEDKQLNLLPMILQHYPSLSTQLDINEQLIFHDYFMQSSYSFNDIIELINNENSMKNILLKNNK